MKKENKVYHRLYFKAKVGVKPVKKRMNILQRNKNEALKIIVDTPAKKSALISVKITEELDIFYIFFSEA